MDCNALKASQERVTSTYPSMAFLQHYDFEIEYRKGERLKHADFFSRNHIVPVVMNLTNDDDDWFIMEQHRDLKLKEIQSNLIKSCTWSMS